VKIFLFEDRSLDLQGTVLLHGAATHKLSCPT
jgi:hypothetical protein